MNNDITNTVTLNLADFLHMRDEAADFETLLNVILDTSRLGYDNSYLLYSEDSINAALKFIAPERYKSRLAALNEEDEKED